MKITITASEVQKFAVSMAPVTAYVDADLNQNLELGETPANMTGQMISDIMGLMTSKGLVAEDGPMSVRITKKGDLQVEIKEEFVMEYTQVYFQSVMQMIPPVKALMEVFKVQQSDMEALATKWFPTKYDEPVHTTVEEREFSFTI